MSHETLQMVFKELPKPLLDCWRCGCGKQARYCHQDVPYVSEITYSCNPDKACPPYFALEQRLAHITERIQWILAACEIDRDARVELEGLVKESEGI